MAYGSSETGKEKAAKLLAQTVAIDTVLGAPYSAQDTKSFFGRCKSQRVVGVLRCCVCGKTNVTLFKSGEGRICRVCKDKEGKKDG